jgi:hypothetical protein
MVVLEDPSIPNIYRTENPTVTLVRVLTLDGTDVKMTDDICKPFSYVNVMTDSFPDIQASESEPGPVTRDKFGVIVHFRNGDTLRILSNNAEDAEMFRPNYSEVWQHWIYHAEGSTPDLLSYGALEWYKIYFPWNAAEIDGLTACFLATVPPPEQEEILQSAKCLKRVVVDTYQKTLTEIQTWTRHPDDTVTVPHLGRFPDDEAADHIIEDYLKNPALLFKSSS